MNLDDWRSRINELDKQILHLLNQRAEAALSVGDLKRRQERPSYVPERETEILNRLTRASTGPFPVAAVRAVWTEILSACRALEGPLTVGYFGPQATFTHQAALQHFGASATYVASRSVADVFDDVERGRVEYGVVPVENSTEGAVNITLDRLIDSDASICGEVYLPITQHLLSAAPGLADVKTVISHPQALAQCRGWLAANLPEVPTQEVTSTAAAAELAAGDVSIAAIASDLAARLYNVPVLRARIEDNPSNSTRFLIIGRRPPGPSGRDKTSILFAMRNEPGALYRVLEPFSGRGLNLTKIESRPAKVRAWEYVMFVDFEGHRDTPVVAAALDEIRARTVFVKILGSYPAG
ncbi:MAG TPA: prephenate dehydratase [Methylomirabilota bacterium]|jgi:chorismate mutase/prephenate dehydratase